MPKNADERCCDDVDIDGPENKLWTEKAWNY